MAIPEYGDLVRRVCHRLTESAVAFVSALDRTKAPDGIAKLEMRARSFLFLPPCKVAAKIDALPTLEERAKQPRKIAAIPQSMECDQAS
ncbi:hypothetical protein ACNR9P_31185, partial [Burkholderia orbicola]